MQTFDYIVIGSGPAALASAQYASRAGLQTLVLEGDAPGGQVTQIADLENYPGVFPMVNGTDFILNMKEQAKSFGAVFVSARAVSVDKPGTMFCVKTKTEEFQAKCVCLATGAVHKDLGVKGEKEFTGRGVSYCAVCDGPFFRNKKIFVVGGGDSACSEAIYLSTLSNDVSIIHRRDSFRAQKAVVDKMISCGVKPIYNTVVEEISGGMKVEKLILKNTQTGEISETPADAVFIFAGMAPTSDLVDMLKKDEGGYILTDEKMQTMIPGLLVAGDVRAKPFRQIVTAVSDGAIAANTAAEMIHNS
ncbi:MAG: thioredoxin-disulfide reductase [Treponema sp.]|nr:thioredoxin-disulfide reductase [Treponema sp.]